MTVSFVHGKAEGQGTLILLFTFQEALDFAEPVILKIKGDLNLNF